MNIEHDLSRQVIVHKKNGRVVGRLDGGFWFVLNGPPELVEKLRVLVTLGGDAQSLGHHWIMDLPVDALKGADWDTVHYNTATYSEDFRP